MLLHIKHTPGSRRFLTKDGNQIAAARREGTLWRVRGGKTAWTVDPVHYTLAQDGAAPYSAAPSFVPSGPLTPPRAISMDVQAPWGLLKVLRHKDCSVEVRQDGTVVAETTPFFSLHPVTLTCTEAQPPAFWAALYLLIEAMMHEDDVEVV